MKPMKPMQPMKPLGPMTGDSATGKSWWPHELGTPSVSGSSNALRYAYFAGKHRLAVDDGQNVNVYDTGDEAISGFSSTDGKTLTFHTKDGSLKLSSLKLL